MGGWINIHDRWLNRHLARLQAVSSSLTLGHLHCSPGETWVPSQNSDSFKEPRVSSLAQTKVCGSLDVLRQSLVRLANHPAVPGRHRAEPSSCRLHNKKHSGL